MNIIDFLISFANEEKAETHSRMVAASWDEVIEKLKELKEQKMDNTNVKEFLELVKANPDLPILPFVDYEVVPGDDYAWWLGSFGISRVGKYVQFSMRGEDRLFTDGEQDDIEEYIADELCDAVDCVNMTDEEIEKLAHERAEALPWVKAIIVYIGMPEE